MSPTTARAPILRPRISEVAAEIAKNAKILEDYIMSQGLPYPSFAADGPSAFPLPPPSTPENEKLHGARYQLLSTSKLMYDLIAGPSELNQWNALNFNDTACLQVIYNFKIAQFVPETGDISFEDLGSKVNIPATKLGQVLRYAMTNHIFYEPRDGYVAHTASSLLLRDENLPASAWVGVCVDEFFHASTNATKALKNFPHHEDIEKSAFSISPMFNGKGYFEYLSTDPELSRRFGLSMSQWSSGVGLKADSLIKGYNWGKLPKGATIVDVGGATGFVCVEVAKAYPHLKFHIQDLSVPSLETGQRNLARDNPELVGNFEYQEHDFFTQQPVNGAEVYFFRFILHDWPDKYVLQILKNIVPALKNGSKIVVSDFILPPPNCLHPWEERRARYVIYLRYWVFFLSRPSMRMVIDSQLTTLCIILNAGQPTLSCSSCLTHANDERRTGEGYSLKWIQSLDLTAFKRWMVRYWESSSAPMLTSRRHRPYLIY
ncbi:hypothetical protein TWF225_001752 [Orbilia oligospora]|nr:hypothetical protein TWF751_004561 [Orbilia oligospora]KAF3190776.1 hypothetical protein TWF225_001752 [Orbilia oligospora]KAF3232854.1 hypothetical protein TWF128_003520 [Orbilia oligospora]KAF3255697.1 hypothetical protein TWF217_006519 [Orbilia oligospora]KAF3284025.1 hypothetical protein TWF132_009913 [Orbilia oligospora]